MYKNEYNIISNVHYKSLQSQGLMGNAVMMRNSRININIQ